MARDPSCIFCQIVSGEAGAAIVYQDDRLTAFMDINPVTPGHLLLVPNDHAADLTDVDEGAQERMMVVAARLDRALRRAGLRCEAVLLYMADGEAAGQEVAHSHLHLIPRYAGDGVGLRRGPGSPAQTADLAAQAERIRGALEGD